eukprot:gnl/TRDRNA2_/TRDRNA2_86074_c0_seq3.p1 gnl/TRDRNA2_/TRDRNA2_86074_c0~~gnl/TRDRNA2_/TRDRNA2_86074_c0_seq3.p1  ORF type:complete len:104 (+),score=21.50 gnl/TRDRNA2_/TRDRNA2_86074_c0_seq3:97-408(+)
MTWLQTPQWTKKETKLINKMHAVRSIFAATSRSQPVKVTSVLKRKTGQSHSRQAQTKPVAKGQKKEQSPFVKAPCLLKISSKSAPKVMSPILRDTPRMSNCLL